MNELNQIKVNLKESNQFKPYLSFDKSLFGQLNSNEYSSDPFLKSKILTEQQPSEILKLCEILYRASEHGFASNDFHSKCDGKGNTLIIFKASESLFIFGCFASSTWDGKSY